jgi:hypothetical protein
VNNWTKEQRAIAAADLLERAAREARAGDVGAVRCLTLIHDLAADVYDPEPDYRFGLKRRGLSPADIDAAVAAISRGEHPPDSLPGRLIARRRRCLRDASTSSSATAIDQHGAYASAFGDVLDMLGVATR